MWSLCEWWLLAAILSKSIYIEPHSYIRSQWRPEWWWISSITMHDARNIGKRNCTIHHPEVTVLHLNSFSNSSQLAYNLLSTCFHLAEICIKLGTYSRTSMYEEMCLICVIALECLPRLYGYRWSLNCIFGLAGSWILFVSLTATEQVTDACRRVWLTLADFRISLVTLKRLPFSSVIALQSRNNDISIHQSLGLSRLN